VRRWAGAFSPPPQLLVFAEAEHFFHGRLGELRSGVLDFLRETASREK
jgi:alpha/beta superfamily hydrolase